MLRYCIRRKYSDSGAHKINKPVNNYSPATGIKNGMNSDMVFALMQNFPNHFNPTTEIKFSIARTYMATIKVYDILGREVKTLMKGEKLSGEYKI